MRNCAVTVIAAIGLSGLIGVPPVAAANQAPGTASLRLDVGPAVAASGRTGRGSFMCSDGGQCVFEVPLKSTLEISASGPRGHRFEWSGCTRVLAPDRCTVDVTADPTHITVR